MSRRNGHRNGNGAGPQLELVAPDQQFVRAPDVDRVVEALIATHAVTFAHLRNFNLLLLFKKGTPPKAEESGSFIHAIARAFKVPPLWQSVTGYEVGFWVWEWWWDRFAPEQREALAMHELLHIGISGGKPRMEKHDVEDFALVVRHYGRWSDSVKLYAQQLSLFEAEQTQPVG
jgi:predicted metallopeptidase